MSKYVPLTIEAETLSALDAEHDDVHVFKGKEKSPWLCVIRRPTFDETQAYKEMTNAPAKKSLANVKLITAISVFPKKGSEDWNAQIQRWGFFPDAICQTDEFKDFVGLAANETEK